MERPISLRFALIAALVAFSLAPFSFISADTDENFWDGFLFEAELTAGEETHDATPAVATGHSGVWFAGEGIAMNYWLSVFSEEAIIGAHFHCAPVGEDGPIVVHLENSAAGGATSTPVHGEIGRAYLSDADIAETAAGCSETIGYPIEDLSDLARALHEGNIYTNIHTPTYPAGAARGQLLPHELPDDEEPDEEDRFDRGRDERPERPSR
jgi:hypothetical protein